VIRASALKNRLKNSKYLSAENEDEPLELVKADLKNTNAGDRVYVKSLGSYAKIVKIKNEKGEAEVLIGDIKTVVKLKDLFNNEKDAETTETVKINRPSAMGNPKAELNVVGKTSLEALTELENFIDQAVRFNLEEIKIIHGVGEGILLKAVRNYLKTDKNVKEFRRGRYGEGENGVTIVTLK
ncbi:MAG: Smr/MutS family protein, partial [Candidatus Borkfalkiaceae bacterium]|nr:Smr/MutS family protein [Christensenellaceae bacterium]